MSIDAIDPRDAHLGRETACRPCPYCRCCDFHVADPFCRCVECACYDGGR